MTWGIPPARCRSVATKRPDGFRSHNTGTRVRMASKSSSVRGTPAARAIARKWSTALVEPPIAIVTAIAFSNALRVRICRGRRSRPMAETSISAERAALSAFSASSAAMVDEYGRLRPIASNAEDIVFAVNIPPHEPAPGHARRSTSSSSAASIRPALNSPTASKTLTTVRSRPAYRPGLMVPP